MCCGKGFQTKLLPTHPPMPELQKRLFFLLSENTFRNHSKILRFVLIIKCYSSMQRYPQKFIKHYFNFELLHACIKILLTELLFKSTAPVPVVWLETWTCFLRLEIFFPFLKDLFFFYHLQKCSELRGNRCYNFAAQTFRELNFTLKLRKHEHLLFLPLLPDYLLQRGVAFSRAKKRTLYLTEGNKPFRAASWLVFVVNEAWRDLGIRKEEHSLIPSLLQWEMDTALLFYFARSYFPSDLMRRGLHILFYFILILEL